MLICNIMTDKGLPYVVSIDCTNMMRCTFEVDPQYPIGYKNCRLCIIVNSLSNDEHCFSVEMHHHCRHQFHLEGLRTMQLIVIVVFC